MLAARSILSAATPDLSKPSLGVEVSADLEVHPDWPPTPLWWKAIKAHTRERYGTPQVNLASEVNGWVPGTDGKPVFALGHDQIGSNDTVRLSRERLSAPMISCYGLTDPGEGWRQTARVLLPRVVSTLMGSGAWNDPGVAAFTLAAGLRPTIPLRPGTTLYLYGQRHSGKTWTATKIMGFWSAQPGSFGANSTGGSANDTATAMELALYKLPIWLADDLAPDVSRRTAEGRESAVMTALRSVYNGPSRNRAKGDGEARKSHPPRALFVVTAEDSLATSSANDRAISVQFSNRSLGKLDAVNEMFEHTSDPATLTGCVLRWILEEASADGWGSFIESCEQWRAEVDRLLCGELVRCGIDAGEVTRFRGMSADVLSTLLMLRQMCLDLGIQDDPGVSWLVDDSAVASAFKIVLSALVRRSDLAPGRQAYAALLAALESGAGHVVGMTGEQPCTDADRGTEVSMALGWHRGRDSVLAPSPGSRTIGFFQPDDEGGDGTVFLLPSVAVGAMKAAPESAVPPRHSAEQVMRDMGSEGLLVQRGERPDQVTFVKKIGGASKRVAAMRLSTLLGEDQG